MIIVNLHEADKFARKRADSRIFLREWIGKVQVGDWNSFLELKKTFKSADYRKPFVIFNLGGNSYRLVAEVNYVLGKVRIVRIGTHDEYNGWKL